MDIQTLLYNLREEVTCPVCSDVFTDPKQLACLHSFCLKCLKHWQETCADENNVKCPKCQTLCRVPASGDLKDLPTSFYLNGLIDVLAIKECTNSQVTCGNCDKKSSDACYCFQCCIFYCEQCVAAHDVFRSKKGHRVLAVKNFQDKDYEDILKRPVFCARQGHQKKLKYFCTECETAACQTCVTLDHGGHRLKLIEEEAESQKLAIETMTQTQRHKLQAKISVVTQLDEDYAKLIQQSENVKRDVELFADGLIKTIEAKKQCMIAEVGRQTNKSLESLTAKKTAIQREINIVESSLEKVDKLLARSTNAEIVQLKNSLETIFEGVDQTEPIAHDSEGLIAFFFVESQKMHGNVNAEKIGSLEVPNHTIASRSLAEGKGLKEGTVGRKAQFNVITRNAERRQWYDERDRVTVEIREEQEHATEVQIDDNKNGLYNISYFPRVPGICKVSVKVNGENICGSTFNSLVKPFHVKPVLTFGQEGSSIGMLKDVRAVSVNNKDEIAVTDRGNNRVQIFDSSGNYLRSPGRGQRNCPLGIAFDKNGRVYVLDNPNCQIQIFTEEGEHLRTFGEKGSLDNQLFDPCGLSIDSDENIIVADSGNKVIKIFSPDGKFLMKIGGPDYFTYPIHCVQCNEFLMVADMNKTCIFVFDRKGNYRYKFGNPGMGDGQFRRPRCLSVTKSEHLLVCDSNNNRIQAFDLNGMFVGKFGTPGNKLGELKNPWSVAVLSNDQIVVCDNGNHRIQIFE